MLKFMKYEKVVVFSLIIHPELNKVFGDYTDIICVST